MPQLSSPRLPWVTCKTSKLIKSVDKKHHVDQSTITVEQQKIKDNSILNKLISETEDIILVEYEYLLTACCHCNIKCF